MIFCGFFAFHGIASIGTDSGGISDAIINHETGLLCTAEDQDDITYKIKMMLLDNKKRETMGNAGMKVANKLFTWDNKIKEYLALVEESKL